MRTTLVPKSSSPAPEEGKKTNPGNEAQHFHLSFSEAHCLISLPDGSALQFVDGDLYENLVLELWQFFVDE